MREVDQAEQYAAELLLRENEAKLKSYEGVHYVDVGYKFVKGRPTEQLALRVHVHQKALDESGLEIDQISRES